MRIENAEDLTLMYWLGAENWHKGGVEMTDVPTPEPHPNEIATRKAVEDGIYKAEDVGLPG